MTNREVNNRNSGHPEKKGNKLIRELSSKRGKMVEQGTTRQKELEPEVRLAGSNWEEVKKFTSIEDFSKYFSRLGLGELLKYKVLFYILEKGVYKKFNYDKGEDFCVEGLGISKESVYKSMELIFYREKLKERRLRGDIGSLLQLYLIKNSGAKEDVFIRLWNNEVKKNKNITTKRLIEIIKIAEGRNVLGELLGLEKPVEEKQEEKGLPTSFVESVFKEVEKLVEKIKDIEHLRNYLRKLEICELVRFGLLRLVEREKFYVNWGLKTFSEFLKKIGITASAYQKGLELIGIYNRFLLKRIKGLPQNFFQLFIIQSSGLDIVKILEVWDKKFKKLKPTFRQVFSLVRELGGKVEEILKSFGLTIKREEKEKKDMLEENIDSKKEQLQPMQKESEQKKDGEENSDPDSDMKVYRAIKSEEESKTENNVLEENKDENEENKGDSNAEEENKEKEKESNEDDSPREPVKITFLGKGPFKGISPETARAIDLIVKTFNAEVVGFMDKESDEIVLLSEAEEARSEKIRGWTEVIRANFLSFFSIAKKIIEREEGNVTRNKLKAVFDYILAAFYDYGEKIADVFVDSSRYQTMTIERQDVFEAIHNGFYLVFLSCKEIILETLDAFDEQRYKELIFFIVNQYALQVEEFISLVLNEKSP